MEQTQPPRLISDESLAGYSNRSTPSCSSTPQEKQTTESSPTDKLCRHRKSDSGYTSGQDESAMYDVLLRAAKQSYENEIAALKDEQEDAIKDLQKELRSITGTKEHVQKLVKKEMLAKKDLQQRFNTLREEHCAVLEDLKSTKQGVAAKNDQVLALRGRAREMTKELFDKGTVYQAALVDMSNHARKLVEERNLLKQEVVALRADAVAHANITENLGQGSSPCPQVSKQGSVGVIGQKPATFATHDGHWEAWYHNSFEETQTLRAELEKVTKERMEAMGIAKDIKAQLTCAEKVAVDLKAEIASKQEQLEIAERVHEQTRHQNVVLRKRGNESIEALDKIQEERTQADKATAAEIKQLTRKLDNQTAAMNASEKTKDAWKTDSEKVLRMLSGRVTTDKLVTDLAEHMELLLSDNESVAEKMLRQEKEVDGLNEQLVLADSQYNHLSRALTEKAQLNILLQDKIFDLEAATISRAIDGEVHELAEPAYFQAMEKVAELEAQLDKQAVKNAALVADRADSGPRETIKGLNAVIERLTTDLGKLQDTLSAERLERWKDGYVEAAHIETLKMPIHNLEHYKQRAVNAEKVWDRVRELELDIEKDRVAHLKSDATTLEFRSQLEAEVAKNEALVGQMLQEIERLRAQSGSFAVDVSLYEDPDQNVAGMGSGQVDQAATSNLVEMEKLLEAERMMARDLEYQLDQMRIAAMENLRRHNTEVEQLKTFMDRVYQRMLRLEVTLDVVGKTIDEQDDEGEALKAGCDHLLGYDDNVYAEDDGPPLGLWESNEEDTESELGDEEVGFEMEAEEGNEQPDDDITIKARDFVAQTLADPNAASRVLGEMLEPEIKTISEVSTEAEADWEDVSSHEVTEDIQESQQDSLPAASIRWAQQHSPFLYGEPVADDQFGHKALLRRRLGKARLRDH